MISEKMFRDACVAEGAKQVSDAALKAWNEWMLKFMKEEARAAAQRALGDKRVRVERRDIGD